MSRLADYFVIVGYDHEKDRNGASNGIILQRFPAKDWNDTPFIEGIEWFCQPQGWTLSSDRQEPKFFVSVLTDIDANRHYCACLCFNETVSITPSKPVDEEEDALLVDDGNSHTTATITHHSIMYAPKCLVLVSRLDYIETFRNCLGIIYTVYVENIDVPLETLVGNILGCVQVPPPGGPQVRFSIGAGDRQALQPPISPSLPVTHTSVSLLFQQLGIRNVLVLFCAIMTEHKILFHSKSYNRLTDGCRALTALMYPFRYSHVYIPLLPAALVEVLSTPTPFVMGVHSMLQADVAELMDVILVDLDGGSITVPDGVSLPLLPEPLLSSVQEALSLVLQPELRCADHAFPPLIIRAPQIAMLDKEIRAVFMRTFAQLLHGYRSCLTLIRIHPRPVITFHKAAFLGERGLCDCEFTTRVLDCMFFNGFVSERGPPWRPCDVWDDLYSGLPDLMREEALDRRLLLAHIQELAGKLYLNENPNPQTYTQKILTPPDGAFARIHQPPLPAINVAQVQLIIDDGLMKNNLKNRLSSLRPIQPRIVPMGPHISYIHDTRNHHLVSNSARRLEVLRNCVNCIFENKISDARKSFPAVLRALKSKQARLALCTELAQHVIGNKAMLEHQQFDLVVRLMNCALQDGSAIDEHGVAAALLPLATAFCRKLCVGVIQFAYTCIQDHSVWQNQQFWEAAFYQDVQKDIKSLYLPSPTHNQQIGYSVLSNRRSSAFFANTTTTTNKVHEEPSALEIAAEQMHFWQNGMDAIKQQESIGNEESTIYSQAIHYANRMVYLLIPLDIGSRVRGASHRNATVCGDSASMLLTLDDERTSNSITNSAVEESDNNSALDAESGFEEQTSGEIFGSTNVVRMVSRFVDKVCTEGGVTAEHVRALHQMVPGVVHMHIETLDGVHRESKRLPPIQKPKILTPSMLAGEEPAMEGLRVYLLPDGREESTAGLQAGAPPLLPAEGAIFLTNYRVIFKGAPCDPFACEQLVVRSLPVTSLTKEKRITVQYLAHLDQWLQEGLQLRSCTFQLIKVAFDEEVTADNIEMFRKLLHRIRHPSHVFHHFAFAGQSIVSQTPLHKNKEKNATLKGFAKKTLLKTARKAGFKQKASSKRQKYVLPNANNASKYMTSPGRMSLPATVEDFTHDDDLSIDDFETNPSGTTTTTGTSFMASVPISIPTADAKKTLERLSERSYVRDWKRLGICDRLCSSPQNSVSGGPASTCTIVRQQFRLATLNTMYTVCRSYPALFIMPACITDESVRRIGRCYRQGRLPCVTWRHPRTHALLLRGSGHHGKGSVVIGMLKSTHPTTPAASNETTVTLEQERYLAALVNATPLAGGSTNYGRYGATAAWSDSNLSIDSLLLAAATADERLSYQHTNTTTSSSTLTPEIARRSNPFNKVIGTLGVFPRTSGGKGAKKNFDRWGSLKDRASQPSLSNTKTDYHVTNNNNNNSKSYHHHVPFHGPNDSDSGVDNSNSIQTFQRAALYILGEKAHTKSIRFESKTAEYIPVDYYDVRHTKASFKKLMRACIPSSLNLEPEHSFHKLVENCEWLQQLRNIMQLSGAVVDLLDVQGSSVAICLEDGWDITAQISAVAQLCLDPYYRTLEGFRTLVEKEWISFGHRFSHRSNLSANSQASGFAPTFLQFLDVVHQIQNQYPLAFEFNEYYLRFIAYHSVSCRFRTFLFDCELERVENGICAVEDKRGSLTSHHKSISVEASASDDEASVYPGASSNRSTSYHHHTNSANTPNHMGQSIFDYIEKQHTRTPLFYNFLYTPDLEQPVLRPQAHLPCLEIWRYYLDEDLAHGPGYELEVIQLDSQHEEEAEAADGVDRNALRKTVTFGYENISKCVPDAFTHLLEEIRKLETDLGHLPQKWKILWDKLELPTTDSLTRHASFSTAMVRSHGRLLHKRSTLEILMRGKMVGAEAAAAAAASTTTTTTTHVYSHPHRFDKYNYTTPTYCDWCSNVLWGPVKTGMRCIDCGYSCHDKCTDHVPKNCTKYKAIPVGNADSTTDCSSSLISGGGTLSKRNENHHHHHKSEEGAMRNRSANNNNNNSSSNGNNDSSSSVVVHQTSSQQYYEQFSSNVAENRTHEGYLYKRGALLKGWKQRWFVLDSIKHQLRYYDAMEDSHCKGFIDLAEVIAVSQATPAPGPPKKTDDKSFFDLRTSRRTYNFCASDASVAQEWIEKLQACLQ